MKFTRTEIPDVVVVEPLVHEDDRGYFFESFRLDKLEDFLGIRLSFCQDNESFSKYGALRGLHYQLPPFSQTKLVRVVEGEVLDISVDIRKGSPTFGKHVSIKLSSDNKKQLFIPRGFAHGFVVLSEKCKFAYKTDNYYHPELDRGIKFDDPFLGIDWILKKEDVHLSMKDNSFKNFLEAEHVDNSTRLYDGLR